MAVDEALLDEAADHGRAALRFYQWREPTLSLGYFQSHRQRDSHPASQDAAVVRRLSGGGALLHDRELTYSICLPAAHPVARSSAALYGIVHGAIIRVLAPSQIGALLHGDQNPESADDDNVFLCFARRTPSDVVVKLGVDAPRDAKIVGSAQRRRRGAVLQHGAILLAASARAPELPGLAELADVTVAPERLADGLAPALAAVLGLQLDADRPDDELTEKARRLERERFGTRAWTERR